MPKTKTKIPNFTKSEIRGWIRIQKIMREYDRQAQEAYAKKERLLYAATNMLKDGFGLEEVARITELPKEQIRAFSKGKPWC